MMEMENMVVDLRNSDPVEADKGNGVGSTSERLIAEESRGEEGGGEEAGHRDEEEDAEEDEEAAFIKLQEEVASLQRKPEIPVDTPLAALLLPPKIFVRDYYPIGRRVNEYSKPEWVTDIAVALRNNQALTEFLNSQFGSLFKIPPRRLAFSGKIVHNMLSRQLWSRNEGELWVVFAGQPIRYSQKRSTSNR